MIAICFALNVGFVIAIARGDQAAVISQTDGVLTAFVVRSGVGQAVQQPSLCTRLEAERFLGMSGLSLFFFFQLNKYSCHRKAYLQFVIGASWLFLMRALGESIGAALREEDHHSDTRTRNQ